uniref:Uncharacterized protein n=1 Tax=Setaria digitata TaxID=48799 RepID=A0A915Q702_9BILA
MMNGKQMEQCKKENKKEKEQRELSFPNLEPKYIPAKKAVSILAVIQLMLASSHFIENTVLLHQNYHDFYDGEGR